MLIWFFYVLFTLAIGYVVLVLFGSTRSSQSSKSTSIDDFIDSEDDGENDGGTTASNRANDKSKYYTKYTTPGRQVLVMYGTEYGFAEEIARKVFDRLAMVASEDDQQTTLQPRLLNAKNHSMVDFSKEQVILCIFSTTGDGAPPSDARDFISFLSSPPPLSHLHYSVLALGDSSYPHYCRTGKQLDLLLASADCHCIVPRVDIDQEDWLAINGWISSTLEALPTLNLTLQQDYLDLTTILEDEEGLYTRLRPFIATMVCKRPLTVMDDINTDKETIHCEFNLTELQYTSGDALGIYPSNNPTEVKEIIRSLHASGEELVSIPAHAPSLPNIRPQDDTNTLSLYNVLLDLYDLKSVRAELIKSVSNTVSDSVEKHKAETLLSGGINKDNSILFQYLADHEVIDVLRDFPSHCCPLQLFLDSLKLLQPRYYSIASSPTKGLTHVAVCAAVIRYRLYNTPRTGVCTTFLQDRLETGGQVPVFISSNPDFRLPRDNSIPIIMVGPGTGISPFRAFIQERGMASGTNLLYFGCRHRNKDYLYRDELEEWNANGTIQLRVAFSRDQKHKVYVQDLIKEDSALIWELLQNGAHLYVCGDAKYMAHDVHMAIVHGVSVMSKCSLQEAEEYMRRMEEEGRYQRDVWVT